MRIVSYNILNGGEGRADPLAEVIEAQRPDIVALVEAEFPPVVERIANRLKMDYVVADANGTAAALLSRFPIESSINLALLHPDVMTKSFLRATLRTLEGPLDVGVVHLHAYAFEGDENVRMREIERVLAVFEPWRLANRPHLLAGDFNSTSPDQQIDINQCRPSTQQAYAANGGQIPRRVVQRICDAGYLDALSRATRGSIDRVGSFTTQVPGERVDHIFSFGIDPNRMRAAHVEQDRLAKYASDHFPVFLEIA